MVSVHLVEHLKKSVDLWLKLSVRVAIAFVEILTESIELMVSSKDAIWVEHRQNYELETF